MCITNDDTTRNGSKHNNVMKQKKMFEEVEGNDEKVVTIKESKETRDEKKTKVATKMKEKNDKTKYL
jgi:hypothetical protein